jgi:hypothetical protein
MTAKKVAVIKAARILIIVSDYAHMLQKSNTKWSSVSENCTVLYACASQAGITVTLPPAAVGDDAGWWNAAKVW